MSSAPTTIPTMTVSTPILTIIRGISPPRTATSDAHPRLPGRQGCASFLRALAGGSPAEAVATEQVSHQPERGVASRRIADVLGTRPTTRPCLHDESHQA